jgi:hypothetical protein
MESADSGNSTGVGLLVVAGVVGLVESGGVGCERSHPQITMTAKQTTTDLKRCVLASLDKHFQPQSAYKGPYAEGSGVGRGWNQ